MSVHVSMVLCVFPRTPLTVASPIPAILAYVASFVLIQYQLTDAEKTEQATERPSTVSSSKPEGHTRLQSFSAESTLSPWEAYTDLRALVSVYQVRFLSILSCGIVPRQARAAKRDRDPEKTAVAATAAEMSTRILASSRVREEMSAPSFSIFSWASTAARGRRCVARW